MWTWWWIIWKSSNFCGSPLSFKSFKALRRLPKRLKTLELRSGDTHKNSNVPQMLLAFEETVWSKKYFYWWTVRLHLNFYVHNLKIFIHICLAKISLWSVWRDLREAKCVDLVVNYMKIFKFLWISTQFQKFLRRYGAFLKIKNFRIEVETRIKIQMFLKCFWLLRKPSDQKNIFIDERFDYIWIFMS